MTPLAGRCHEIAFRLKRQAIWVSVFIASASAAASIAPILLPGSRPVLAALFVFLCTTAALATLAISALLWFDTALFRLMATYPDEISAGQAVDDFLARSGLKPLPQAARPLGDRIAGTRRLIRRQLMFAAASAVFAVLAFAANFA